MKDFLKKYNILPAPMEGVMRPAVMEVCNQLALSQVWVTPFFRVSESVPKVKELKKFLAPFQAPNIKVILQIMGTDAGKLAETALRGMEAAADGIDLNCGCPSNQVIRHGAGAGMWKDPDNTARIIEAVRNSVGSGFFSVKTRLGFNDFNEAPAILKLWSNAAEIDMFTLHYRTAREGYLSVPGREERLREIKNHIVGNPLIFGNGNIESASEATDLCRSAGLDGTMTGRGFWRDPFIAVRHFEAERSSEAPDAKSAQRRLWQKLAQLPYGKNWSIGSAIELASLILGPNSDEAKKLKSQAANK